VESVKLRCGGPFGPALAQENTGGHRKKRNHGRADTNADADLSGLRESGRARVVRLLGVGRFVRCGGR
jgi:hypothetical protein